MSEELSPKRLTFRKTQRLRSSLDFARVYNLKVRAGDGNLLIFAALNGSETTRIGLSVSKKNGNSIQRHRIRRLLKEAYRLEQHQVPSGMDLILIPRPDSGATLEDYRDSLPKLATKLFQRLQQKME